MRLHKDTCIYVFGSLRTCGSGCVWMCLCIHVFMPTICMCVCACVCIPMALLMYQESARINSFYSDLISTYVESSYPHLGSFCLRSTRSFLSTEWFRSLFSLSQRKMKPREKVKRILKFTIFFFSERTIICSEVHRMNNTLAIFPSL